MYKLLKVQFLINAHLLPLSPTLLPLSHSVPVLESFKVVDEGNGGIPLHWVIDLVNVS